MERAIAAYQALIEFNLFSPIDYKNKKFYDRIDFFKEFWDSEVPRFGDLHANGWSHFINTDQVHHYEGLDSNEKSFDTSNINTFSDWVKMEKQSFVYNWLPLRQSEDGKLVLS